ncbi:MAG: hypothetical protein HQL40_14450 [Alphaproteobacteria bacterium]|nr:hypothetical protein [Alphaproteobacteria bacterium]
MRTSLIIALATLATCGAAQAADNRQLVEMPAMMQEHMLGSMRDHLVALDEILAAVSAERFDAAAKVAETRLGMSSFAQHGAAQMAAYMPKPMQEAGGALHRAASRFAMAATDADVDRSYAAMKGLMGALSEMTTACNGCHVGYRVR